MFAIDRKLEQNTSMEWKDDKASEHRYGMIQILRQEHRYKE